MHFLLYSVKHSVVYSVINCEVYCISVPYPKPGRAENTVYLPAKNKK